ncbi:hypothetical protein BD410DRAFT_830082 [Rickenella mellea]|uniref:DUF6533 domain-containing protein n=1 Tax=Rickenella mellea TaxID=50990 RepID=A0A4Y7PWM6_9AGAM|nr:hypothetical protein BD410DRAFT_830082 [Rickenella mellea]
MSDSPANELKELLDAVGDLRITRALSLSAMVALLYDVILSFPDEVQYVWRAPSSWGKMLYFASRYPIPISYIVWEMYIMGFGVSLPNVCDFMLFFTTWSLWMITFPLQIVLGLRTIAIWERDRRVTALVVLGTVAYNITLLIGDVLLSRQYHYHAQPILEPVLGCYSGVFGVSPTLTKIVYSALMAYEGILFVLILSKAVRSHRIGRGQLIIILLRDGAMYYAAIFAFSIANVILTDFVSLTRIMLSAALAPAMLAAQSIGACHIILNLRKYSYYQGRYASIRTPERRTLLEELSTSVTDEGSHDIQLIYIVKNCRIKIHQNSESIGYRHLRYQMRFISAIHTQNEMSRDSTSPQYDDRMLLPLHRSATHLSSECRHRGNPDDSFQMYFEDWMEKYDVDAVGGLEEGTKGIDEVGSKAVWAEENFGTPAVRGKNVRVKVMSGLRWYFSWLTS